MTRDFLERPHLWPPQPALAVYRRPFFDAFSWNAPGSARTAAATSASTKKIKRRTRVATLFPNEAALLRLVSAVLMEISL